MKVHYDETANAVYFRLDDSPIHESDLVQPGLVLDLNDNGQVVGVEILGVRERVERQHLTHGDFEAS